MEDDSGFCFFFRRPRTVLGRIVEAEAETAAAAAGVAAEADEASLLLFRSFRLR